MRAGGRGLVRVYGGVPAAPMGAYTSNSKGFAYVRKSIAEFINQRDGFSVDADWNNIYLTNGASEAVRTAFKLLIRQ